MVSLRFFRCLLLEAAAPTIQLLLSYYYYSRRANRQPRPSSYLYLTLLCFAVVATQWRIFLVQAALKLKAEADARAEAAQSIATKPPPVFSRISITTQNVAFFHDSHIALDGFPTITAFSGQLMLGNPDVICIQQADEREDKWYEKTLLPGYKVISSVETHKGFTVLFIRSSLAPFTLSFQSRVLPFLRESNMAANSELPSLVPLMVFIPKREQKNELPMQKKCLVTVNLKT